MSIEVEGPDGAIHEFPDGTSPDVIKAAMAKHYGAPAAKPKRTAEDLADNPLTAAVEGFKSAGRNLKRDFQTAYSPGGNGPGNPGGARSAAADRLEGDLAEMITHPVGEMVASALKKPSGAFERLLDPKSTDAEAGRDVSMVLGMASPYLPLPKGPNFLKGLSQASEAASSASAGERMAEATAAAEKPRVRVKAGSRPTAIAADAAEAERKNTLADAQKAWTKSSGDPKHAERAVKLIDNGVELTVGQRAGGMAKRIEEANKSNPYIGQAIRDNERRSLISFNRATAKQSLEAAGLPSTFPAGAEGRDFVKVAHDRFSKAYDANASKYKLTGDEALQDALTTTHAALRELPSDKRLQFENIMDRRLFDRMGIKLGKDEGFADAVKAMKGKTLNGKTFKDVESELTYLSGKYHSAADPADNLFAEHLDDVLGALRDNMERTSDPSVRKQLKKLNTGYAMFTRVRAAAQNRATSGGVFTTGDFLGAVKRLDRSKAKGAFARGDALFQDFAEDAHAVLSNVLADSGTTERQNITRPGLIGSGAGAAVGSMLGGPIGAAAGIGVEAAARPTVNALADKMLQARTESLINGQPRVAPGGVNNYLRATQMRAGQYTLPRAVMQGAMISNQAQENQQ